MEITLGHKYRWHATNKSLINCPANVSQYFRIYIMITYYSDVLLTTYKEWFAADNIISHYLYYYYSQHTTPILMLFFPADFISFHVPH